MKVKIERSNFGVLDIIISFLSTAIPTVFVFFYLYSGKTNAVELFFSTFFLFYVPSFTFVLAKRMEKFKKIKVVDTVSPILIKFVLGLMLTAILFRPLVNENTVFIEISLYFIAGPILLLFNVNKK